MLSSGDVQGCLRGLESLLRAVRYPGHVDHSGISKGDPSAFLPIVSFTLTSFSSPLAEQLLAAGLDLTGKTDLRFTDTLYKVLRDIFQYKPVLTKQQFLQWGFSQRKISVVCDIINLVLQKHKQLKKPRGRCPGSQRDGIGEAHPTQTDLDTVSKRAFVVNHTDHLSTDSSHRVTSPSHHDEVCSNSSPEGGITEGQEDQEDIVLHSSEVDGRLSAMEAQLESVLSRLDGLRMMEKRLEQLERRRNSDQNGGEVITICSKSWDNLMSRLLLLETKLELSNAQVNAASPCPSSSTFSSKPDSSKEDLKDRLESITSMLKSTSSLLKKTEPSTTPCK
ncbi:centrosomal protein of 44 kDa isoform X1 [Scophthalmus maximus]|uniref:centrosomal protein of 44 kDa isoform X1 n=1 Tax=Scophthalmus maximus TaxID=52904 RepID=UPI0015E06F98|nr:centrosomal protein of 44 kDa isoform X1 [Scophthalmus maximus]